jgi:type II secretory pathway component PulF
MPLAGQIEAEDLKSALLALEKQGLIVSSIYQLDPEATPAEAVSAVPSPQSPTEAEQAALQRQFARVLESGKQLSPALVAYARELPPGRHRRRLLHVACQLERGDDPSHEPATGPINDEWLPILSARDSSGDPIRVLTGIIDASRRAGSFRRHLASALAYPLLLLAFSLVLVSLFSWWLVPAYQEIFTGLEFNLPYATRLVLRISDVIRESRGLVILIPASVLAAIVVSFRTCPRTGCPGWIFRHLPVLSSTVRLWDVARFVRCLADMLESEVPVADALRISGRITGQPEIRQEANQLATQLDLRSTKHVAEQPLQRCLPQTATHVLRLNASPSATARMLRELFWMYDQETSKRLAWLSSLAGPVCVVLLGVLVGFYVVALSMPLFVLIRNIAPSLVPW